MSLINFLIVAARNLEDLSVSSLFDLKGINSMPMTLRVTCNGLTIYPSLA